MIIERGKSKTSLDNISTIIYWGSGLAPLIRYNVSTSSLGDLSGFAEYDFKYRISQYKFSDSSPLDFLDSGIRDLVGQKVESLKTLETSLFPTIYSEGIKPGDQSYFGSMLIDDKYFLLLDVPEEYEFVYIYDTEVTLLDIGGEIDKSDYLIKITLQKEREIIRDGKAETVNEVEARDLIWLVLTTSNAPLTSINLAYHCWVRSINPARNKSEHNLRNDEFYSVSGSVLTKDGRDVLSGSVLGGYVISSTPILHSRLQCASGWSPVAKYRGGQACSGWLALSDTVGNKPGISSDWIREDTISDLGGLDTVYIQPTPSFSGILYMSDTTPATSSEFSLPDRVPATYNPVSRQDYYGDHPELVRPEIVFWIKAESGYQFDIDHLLTDQTLIPEIWDEYYKLGSWTATQPSADMLEVHVPYQTFGKWEVNDQYEDVLVGTYNLWDDKILPGGGDIFVRMIEAIASLVFYTSDNHYLALVDGSKLVLDLADTIYADDYFEFTSDAFTVPVVDPTTGGYIVPVNMHSENPVYVSTKPRNILYISEVEDMTVDTAENKLVPTLSYTKTRIPKRMVMKPRQLELTMSSTNYFGVDMNVTSLYTDFPDLSNPPTISDTQFIVKPGHTFHDDPDTGYAVSIRVRYGNSLDKITGFTAENVTEAMTSDSGYWSIRAIEAGEIPGTTVESRVKLGYDKQTRIFTLTFDSYLYDADVVININ